MNPAQPKKPNAKAANLGFAHVDLDRKQRQGIGEVIFGAGKTPEQLVAITQQIYEKEKFVLITRLNKDQADAVRTHFPTAVWHETARIIVLGKITHEKELPGVVSVVSAGTSDMPIAEEAAVAAEALGQTVQRIYDVGVAGIHRLLHYEDELRKSRVIIVVAGMEGALPSVVAGLVDCPVIAVPTSIGYGASFDGLAALLGMMNSCGSGVTVVNIDNGFGAAFAAVQMNRLSIRIVPS